MAKGSIGCGSSARGIMLLCTRLLFWLVASWTPSRTNCDRRHTGSTVLITSCACGVLKVGSTVLLLTTCGQHGCARL